MHIFPTKRVGVILGICILLVGVFIPASAQVGIGTNNPHPSAVLDLESTNQGVLLPRVALTGTGDTSTIASPATSLMVYNTATAGGLTPGFHYWDGTAWATLGTNTLNSLIDIPGGTPNDGDILTYDATTSKWTSISRDGLRDLIQQPEFSVSYPGETNVGNAGAIDPIPFPNVSKNVGGAWNAATNRFEVPEDGQYLITIQVRVRSNGGSGDANVAGLPGMPILNQALSAGTVFTINYSNTLSFTAGDSHRLRVNFCGGCSASSYTLVSASWSAVRVGS